MYGLTGRWLLLVLMTCLVIPMSLCILFYFIYFKSGTEDNFFFFYTNGEQGFCIRICIRKQNMKPG